jgi:integrase
MRALLIFAAYSGMRPGELFALEWPDIDFDAMRSA